MNIEDLIKKAVEEGKFKDLPGQGKPLNLDENPFEDPGWRLANKILKDNGFSPAWIETRKEIDAEVAGARRAAQLAWQEYQTAGGSSARIDDQTRWKTAHHLFVQRIQAVNKLIFQYNIQAPSIQVQMRSLDADEELTKITQTGAGNVSSSLS
jgi:hypothetical protein